MDQLPLELVMHIVSMVVANHNKDDRSVRNKTKDSHSRAVARVVNSSLAGLATVSRKFQRAVEPYLFSHLEVQSEELAAFSRIMTKQRQVYLKTLAYTVRLYNRAKRAEELPFGAATSALCQLLDSWAYDHAQAGRHLSLSLSIGTDRMSIGGFEFAANAIPHPSSRSVAPPGAPFRPFGVTDECGGALWELLTDKALSTPSPANIGAPTEGSWSALERLVVRFYNSGIRSNRVIDTFASVCNELPNLRTAALVTTTAYVRNFRHINRAGKRHTRRGIFDAEWGIYFAVAGVRSPWLQTATAPLYEAMQKLTLEAKPPSVLAEDLDVPRMTFNAGGWYPDRQAVSFLCAASSETPVSIVQADLWEEVYCPYLKSEWKRKHPSYRGEVVLD